MFQFGESAGTVSLREFLNLHRDCNRELQIKEIPGEDTSGIFLLCYDCEDAHLVDVILPKGWMPSIDRQGEEGEELGYE